jgi:hypothetical protein
MGLPKGAPKPSGSGRKAGTPNKRMAYDVSRRLEELGVDLMDEILEEMKHLDPRERVRAYLELLEYCAPKLKALEIDGKHTISQEESERIVVRLPDDITTKLLDESSEVA